MVMFKLLKEMEYAIMVGEFRPKQRLVEAELIQRFGVGRGLIRDSLKILAERRLIERDENKGAVVAELSAKDVSNLYFLRSHLEGLAAQMAFDRITPENLEKMALLNRELAAYSKLDQKLVTLHEGFHEIIFNASENEFLIWKIKRLIAIAGPVRYFSYAQTDQRERTLEEHEKIILTLKKKEKDGFVELCRNHMIPPMKAYVRIFFPQEANDVLAKWE